MTDNPAYVPAPDWVRWTSLDVDPSNHHYIVLSFLHKWMSERALPVARGRLLDYGCGGQPYRALFEPVVDQYIAADVTIYRDKKVDVLLAPNGRAPF